MPDNLSDIVEINISRESTAIDTASFNIPLILTDTAAFADRVREYNTITAVAEDFSSDSNVYKMASRLFGDGGSRPTYIVVGRRNTSEVSYEVGDVIEGAVYTITINEQTYNYVAEEGDTGEDVATGLQTAYGERPVDGISLTAAFSTIVIASSSTDDNLTVTASGNMTQISITSNEPWGDAIAAIESENDVWYGAVSTTHVPDDVLQIAEAIQARHKIFGTSTQDLAVTTTSEDDIGSKLSSFNYDRTYWVYTPFADEDYPEAAWMGSQMPMTPGSNTWNFKQASGVRAAKLTPTQKSNIRKKNGNFLSRRAGVDIFEDGIMSDGEFIDTIIGIDWWYARTQEAIFFRLVNSRKVPYTRAGASLLQAEIMGVNALGVTNGLIADDSPITVIAPDPLRVPATMRAQRMLGDFIVRFRLAGAVHKVRVDATISV